VYSEAGGSIFSFARGEYVKITFLINGEAGKGITACKRDYIVHLPLVIYTDYAIIS